jgi:hypothetical protein
LLTIFLVDSSLIGGGAGGGGGGGISGVEHMIYSIGLFNMFSFCS